MFTRSEEYYHTFPIRHSSVVDDVFGDCESIDDFVRNVASLSNTPESLMDVDSTDHMLGLVPLSDVERLTIANNFKGDAFEFLVEIFLKQFGSSLEIGITHYEVGDPEHDFGVDGMGRGLDGKPAAVQVKYRSNPKHLLTNNGDHIGNLLIRGVFYEGVPPDTDNNLLIITTGAGTHYKTQAEFLSGTATVRTLGLADLQSLMGSTKHPNPMWWNFVREVVVASK